MKVYNSIGSKERFDEMFQRVNKIKLNEDILRENVIENAFNKLKNNQLTIKQTNSQVNGNQNTIEIVTTDKEGSEITFRFRLTGTEGDQEGVFSVESAELIGFKYKSRAYQMEFPEGIPALTNFNRKYANEIADVIGDFVDFSEESAIEDSLYEDAVKLIDKIPYKKGTEDMQTNKAYADEKPTNPELRVKAPELEKVVKETFEDDDDYVIVDDDEYTTEVEPEDPHALPPDYSGIENYSRADKYLPEAESGIDMGKAIMGYYNQLTPEKKEELIRLADELLEANIGVKKYQMPKEVYFKMVRELAIKLFQGKMTGLNETEYPEEMEIGKEFEVKSKYPKEQKKKHKIKKTTISEEENLTDDGMSLESQGDEIAQLAQDKEETGEILHGGKGDGKSPLEFKPDQILLGLKVEKEHTDDPMTAIEIVLDHLSEDPEYYTRKDDPEASAQFGASNDAVSNAEEKPKHPLADILDDDGTAEDLSKTNTGRKGINRAIDNDEEMTDVLLGYKPKNVGDVSEDIIGANGAVSAVGGGETNDDDYQKYQEYEKKNFNSLTDTERDEYFKLWNKYKRK